MADHSIDRAIERVARRQHGAFSLTQARMAGATKSMIESRRRRGGWVQLAPSVYALPGNPLTWHRQLMAAQLSLPGSSVSGLAAAHLIGLDGCRPVRPELTVPRRSSNRSPLARVHQSDRFVAIRVAPYLVGTVAQTLCDCAGRLGPRLDRVLEAAISSGITTPAAVLARCEALALRPPPGLIDLAGQALALQHLPAVPTSVIEVALYRLLADRRVPEWEGQITPAWWPNEDERVDAFIPVWQLIVEADGRAWHTRRADFERDRRRDHIALAHGHRTVRFTHEQLMHEPEYVLGVLLAIGSTAAAVAAS